MNIKILPITQKLLNRVIRKTNKYKKVEKRREIITEKSPKGYKSRIMRELEIPLFVHLRHSCTVDGLPYAQMLGIIRRSGDFVSVLELKKKICYEVMKTHPFRESTSKHFIDQCDYHIQRIQNKKTTPMKPLRDIIFKSSTKESGLLKSTWSPTVFKKFSPTPSWLSPYFIVWQSIDTTYNKSL